MPTNLDQVNDALGLDVSGRKTDRLLRDIHQPHVHDEPEQREALERYDGVPADTITAAPRTPSAYQQGLNDAYAAVRAYAVGRIELVDKWMSRLRADETERRRVFSIMRDEAVDFRNFCDTLTWREDLAASAEKENGDGK